jgi:hypothetical protein
MPSVSTHFVLAFILTLGVAYHFSRYLKEWDGTAEALAKSEDVADGCS